jgi:hypothetical protein
MVTIRRLTEEIGFDYTNKVKDTDIKPISSKKKNPMMEMIIPFLKPVVKSAYDAGKSGENFETWWNNYMESEGENFGKKEKTDRISVGYKK